MWSFCLKRMEQMPHLTVFLAETYEYDRNEVHKTKTLKNHWFINQDKDVPGNPQSIIDAQSYIISKIRYFQIHRHTKDLRLLFRSNHFNPAIISCAA